LYLGRPTGSARPLLWAHAEYLTLLRSAADGEVFDRIAPVADRYLSGGGRKDLEVWKFSRKITRACRGSTIRVVGRAPFRLRWTGDDWQTHADIESNASGIGLYFADLNSTEARGNLTFTFYWPQAQRWEGRDFSIQLI
jgi:glucoamylase